MKQIVVAMACILLAASSSLDAAGLDQKKMAEGKLLHEQLYKSNPTERDFLEAESRVLGHRSDVGSDGAERHEAFHYYLQHTYNFPASLGDYTQGTWDKYVDIWDNEIMSLFKGVKRDVDGDFRYRDWFEQKVVASGRLDAPHSQEIFDRWKVNQEAVIRAHEYDMAVAHGAAEAARAKTNFWAMIVWVGFDLLLSVGFFLLPTIIAWRRKKDNLKAIFVCNLLVIGWPVALVWALTDKKSTVSVPSPNQPEASARLRVLQKLKDDGLVSEEEYQQRRNALLAAL